MPRGSGGLLLSGLEGREALPDGPRRLQWSASLRRSFSMAQWYWGGPSTRPQIWSGFWTQFWGPPAQCVSPGVSAKLQNRSAASPAPPRRSAPIKLQTKAVWPNVRGVIFVARDTGIQGPYSATPPVRD